MEVQYLVTTTHDHAVSGCVFYKGACQLAQELSRLAQCTAYVYRIRLEEGRPRLVEEAFYINGE